MPPWLNPDPEVSASVPAARKEPRKGIRALLGWLGDHEHQLQLALEAAELGQWHWNPGTGELVWSDRTRELLGVAPDTPASFELFQSLILPEDRERVGKAIETALQNRSAYSVEYRVLLADGSTRWLHSLGRARYYPTRSTPASMSGVVRDVSARRQIESQERLWANAFAHAAHGMAIIDPRDATVRRANEAYAGLLGRSSAALAGTPLAQLCADSGQAALRAAIGHAGAAGSASVELEHRHLDGGAIATRLDLVSVRDPQDPAPYLIATITDLRERARLPRRAPPSPAPDQRFRLLAESTSLAIAMSDVQGLLNYANPAWLALKAVPLGQALGRDWCECVHPDDRERVKQVFAHLQHGASAAFEYRYLRPGGEVRWVQAHATVLSDESGRTLGYLRASHDITDSLQQRAARDRTHSQVRALAQRLLQLREVERNEIAGTLQERVYTGLAQLATALGELTRPDGSEWQLLRARQELAGLAGETLEHLRHVVFELTPPGVGELGFEGAMQRLVSEQRGARGTQVVLSLPAKALQVHQWTLCVLYEVAREALANALQHARAARIDVQVELRGDTVRLRVRDNGIGMLPQDHDKPGSFGLLAASERLAQVSGTLRVVGVRNEGTTVEACVPLPPNPRELGIPGETL